MKLTLNVQTLKPISKLDLIKFFRAITGMDLKGVKDFVDNHFTFDAYNMTVDADQTVTVRVSVNPLDLIRKLADPRPDGYALQITPVKVVDLTTGTYPPTR